MSKGIVLPDSDPVIESRAKAAGLAVTVADTAGIATAEIAYDRTLLVEPGTRVPWDLLPAAWHFLERWDAAVPLWRYGVVAADMGTPEERVATEAVIRDLRVLLHAVELVFVRKNEAGQSLVETWAQEQEAGPDKRLAFLRAVYRVKPRLCVLPTAWLGQVAGSRIASRTGGTVKNGPLVTVELEPGRLVKCHKGDESKVLAQFKRQRKAR